MVFFAFHQYLTTNFHVNNFFCGNYISVLFATWNDVSIYFFQIFHTLSLFLFFADVYAMQKKKPQFNSDLFLWRSEVTTIKKDKIFTISLNIAHFSFFFFFFLQSLIPTSWFFYILFWIWKYFSKNVTFWKNSFCHSFLIKIRENKWELSANSRILCQI